MRKEGYYWARHKYMNENEVVQITCFGCEEWVWRNSLDEKYKPSDFYWIDNEPIKEKEMPTQLENGKIYVLQNKATGEKNLGGFLAKHDY